MLLPNVETLKGLSWGPQTGNPKNVVGMEYQDPGRCIPTIFLPLAGIFLLYSYYIIGVPCLGFPLQSLENLEAVYVYIYGGLSKLWCLFGYPKYWVPYYNRDPKRDHNFDNHPYVYICI